MLRPATPLTVILFAAFALTLISVLSAPIIPAIPLSSFQDVSYGWLGYCQSGHCVTQVGYKPPTPGSDFTVSSTSTRHTLPNILIIHPISCLFQLVSLILALIAHFHSPSHSSRYLLGLIVFMLPTLLVTLLAFLVDILLFIPHLAYAGWLVLVAVVLDVLSGIMLCAMRRTLVSRKARRKRIDENAEMSGENFYNRQAAQTAAIQARADSPPPLGSEPTVPSVDGGPDKLPQFASFESGPGRKVSDDRVPLNERTDTNTTASSTMVGTTSHDGPDVYAMGGPGRGGPMNRGRGGRNYGPPRDEFGNPLPPSSAFGSNLSRPDSRTGSFNSRSRGGPPRGGGYGRGGPPGPYGPGRGGPPSNRGGPGPAFTAGAAAGALAGDMGRGRGPPPGYTNESYQMQDRPPMSGAFGPRRQSPGPPSAPGYGQRRQSPGPPSATGYSRGPPPPPGVQAGGYARGPPSEDGQYARAESPPPLPGQGEAYGRAESPPPLHGQVNQSQEEVFHDAVEMEAPHGGMIGQAVEMDERTGSPAHSPNVAQTGFSHFQRTDSPLRQGSAPPISPSVYSSQPTDSIYVPARAAWQSNSGGPVALNRIQSPPAELAGSLDHTTPQPHQQQQQQKPTGGYYEDVDPRFTGDGQGHHHNAPPNIGVALDEPPPQHSYGPGQGYNGPPPRGHDAHTGGYAY